jgi:hypothetical protein
MCCFATTSESLTAKWQLENGASSQAQPIEARVKIPWFNVFQAAEEREQFFPSRIPQTPKVLVLWTLSYRESETDPSSLFVLDICT